MNAGDAAALLVPAVVAFVLTPGVHRRVAPREGSRPVLPKGETVL